VDLEGGLSQVLGDGTNDYLYGNGRIAQANASDTQYFLGDALGSVRQLSDEGGALSLAKGYDPFGNASWSAGAAQTPFGYTGEQTDANGLVYLRARYYAPGVGRFVNKDTWEGRENQPISYNKWLYVNNNPTNLIDPTGNITTSEDEDAKKIIHNLSTTYLVYIKQDWGGSEYELVPSPMTTAPSMTTPPPGSSPSIYPIISNDCNWRTGNWRSLHELELVELAIKDMSEKLGGDTNFKKAMKYFITIHRLPSESIFGYGGLSINNIYLPNNAFYTDIWAKGTVVHELAHVWDGREWPPYEHGEEMASKTESFKIVCVQGSTRYSCPTIYVKGKEDAPTHYAQTNPEEDWAESFKVNLYSSLAEIPLGPIRTNYIDYVIQTNKK
jgi:RHS repeat-associated protein